MGKVLTWEDIVQVNDCEEIPVPVPEWGGDVIIRPLTVQEIDHAKATGKTTTEINKVFLRLSLVKPALTQEKVDALWSTKSGNVVGNLLKAIAQANGMSDKKPEEAQKDREAVFREAGE